MAARFDWSHFCFSTIRTVQIEQSAETMLRGSCPQHDFNVATGLSDDEDDGAGAASAHAAGGKKGDAPGPGVKLCSGSSNSHFILATNSWIDPTGQSRVNQMTPQVSLE
jgi:hypothetical protein